MPDIFAPLVRRMRTIPELRSFRPNEANALDYRRSEGHYLGAHCDDRQLSGPILVNLCLAGDATMTYTRDQAGRGSAGETVRARLSGALQIQSGSVRFDYRHGIQRGLPRRPAPSAGAGSGVGSGAGAGAGAASSVFLVRFCSAALAGDGFSAAKLPIAVAGTKDLKIVERVTVFGAFGGTCRPTTACASAIASKTGRIML
ncbi:alpha-ketoglutarate-dependent dioxygenase alkB-like protein [Aureococcus anophagefferens]|nr:alpha-ketoglutarate-dependent dioxygenase alkB-like protein [Aureococcus anophagefferens]